MPRQFTPSLAELLQIQSRIKADKQYLATEHQFSDKATDKDIHYICNEIIKTEQIEIYTIKLNETLNSRYYVKLLGWNRSQRLIKQGSSRSVRLSKQTTKLLDDLKARPEYTDMADDLLIQEGLNVLI